MNNLLEIQAVSNFHPTNTDVGRLYKLIMEDSSITREEVFQAFNKEKKNSQEYNRYVFKSLKDELINGIFQSSFKGLSKIQQSHFEVMKKYAACKILIGTGKKKAGIPLTRETLALAEKYGILEIALALARELELHFSIVDLNNQKYALYQQKVEKLQQYVFEETAAQSAYAKLAFSIQKKKCTASSKKDIAALELIKPNNKEYKFNLHYYILKTLWYQLHKDNHNLIKTCQDALSFFDEYDRPLSQVVRFSFYFKLIPLLILQKNFEKAEESINRCLTLLNKGSYNWHLTLFYLAILGFYSGRPKIALDAWKQAEQSSKKFKSAVINDRWEIIKAYLFYFDLYGEVKMPGNFRLYRFISQITTANQDKSGLNVSIIVAELLHLLATGNQKKYMERCELLPAYIRDNLRKKEDARARHFLRMLICVEKGDYHLVRVQRYAAAHLKKLKAIDASVSLELLESELIPFEVLWERVLKMIER